jgi:hypothetical protein
MIPEFSGILDGQGHKIYNLLLAGADTASFGVIGINQGTVRHLLLEEVTYNFSRGYVAHCGILVGVNYGTIEDCRIAESSMLCKFSYQTKDSIVAYVGGLTGHNAGTVRSCFVDAKIDAYTTALGDVSNGWYYSVCAIGGLAGSNNGNVVGCTANVVLNGYGATQKYTNKQFVGGSHGYSVIHSGGLIGVMEGGKVELSTACVDSYAGVSSFGCDYNIFVPYVGGFVGEMLGGTVTQCYATGYVVGFGYGSTGYIGGFASLQYGGNIMHSYTEVLVEAGSAAHHAGFVGCTRAVITECYANNPTGSVGSGFAYEADSSATIRNCFTLGTSFVAAGNGLVDKCFYTAETASGSARTPEELMSEEFLLDTLYWDASVWQITGEGYPTLRALDPMKEGVTP